jgi:hypothetical protein
MASEISVSVAYLSEWILDECLVGDQIKETNSGSVESQNVFGRAWVFQFGIYATNLKTIL